MAKKGKKDKDVTLEDLLKGAELAGGMDPNTRARLEALQNAATAAPAPEPEKKSDSELNKDLKKIQRFGGTSDPHLLDVIKKLNETTEKIAENTTKLLNEPEAKVADEEPTDEEKLAAKDLEIEGIRKSLAATSLGKKIGESLRIGIEKALSSIGSFITRVFPILGYGANAIKMVGKGIGGAYKYFKERHELKQQLSSALSEREILAGSVEGEVKSSLKSNDVGQKINSTNKILGAIFKILKRQEERADEASDEAESKLNKARLEPLTGEKKGGMFGGMLDMFKGKLPSLGGMFGGLSKFATNPVTWLVAGIVWAAIDGIKGFFKSKEWSVSSTSGVLGSILGGTSKGLVGAFAGMGKWAMIGAGAGSLIPGVGTLIGGLIGGAFGAIVGWIGGEKIAKFFDNAKNWIAKTFENLKPLAKMMATMGLISGGPIGGIIGALVGSAFSAVADWITGDKFSDSLQGIMDKGTEIISKAFDMLWDIARGVVEKAKSWLPSSSKEDTGPGMYDQSAFSTTAKTTTAGKTTKERYDAVKKYISEAAQKTGVDERALTKTMWVESDFNAFASAKTTTAKGLGQFTKSTWAAMVKKYGSDPKSAAYGITENDITDPSKNAIMTALLMKENTAALNKSGWAANDTNLYLAHFLGAAGGPHLLNAWKATPNKPVNEVVSAGQLKANHSVFWNKDENRWRTVQEVGQWAANKMNRDLGSLGMEVKPGQAGVEFNRAAITQTPPSLLDSARMAVVTGRPWAPETGAPVSVTPSVPSHNAINLSKEDYNLRRGVILPAGVSSSTIPGQVAQLAKTTKESADRARKEQLDALAKTASATQGQYNLINAQATAEQNARVEHPALPNYAELFEELGIDRIFS